MLRSRSVRFMRTSLCCALSLLALLTVIARREADIHWSMQNACEDPNAQPAQEHRVGGFYYNGGGKATRLAGLRWISDAIGKRASTANLTVVGASASDECNVQVHTGLVRTDGIGSSLLLGSNVIKMKGQEEDIVWSDGQYWRESSHVLPALRPAGATCGHSGIGGFYQDTGGGSDSYSGRELRHTRMIAETADGKGLVVIGRDWYVCRVHWVIFGRWLNRTAQRFWVDFAPKGSSAHPTPHNLEGTFDAVNGIVRWADGNYWVKMVDRE